MGTLNDFDVELFEQRLTNLKDTQEGIQQMSSWCLQQRSHHKKIVSSWLNVLKQVRVEHRLTLFYLANDVIQYSKRKNYEFVESWGTTLQKAATLVRDEKVRNKIFRILKIWEQRGIYSDEYLSDLNGLLSMNPVKKTQQSSSELGDEFQNSILITNIKDCTRLEQSTDKNFKNLPKSVPNCDAESIKNTLKDRSRSVEIEKELDDYVTALELYVKSLKAEIKCRSALITNMDQAETFYTNQRGEVKVVVNAYKNFGNRIKVMKKKIEEIAPNLPSPIPSPDINAPSPEPDADIILPDESSFNASTFKNPSNGYSSYMDGTLPFDINDFKRDSPNSTIPYDNSSHSSQAIQVINNRLEEKDDIGFEMNNFFKPIISNNAYSSSVPLPVPPVSNYQRSQAGINSYNDESYDDTAYNPMDAPYTSDSSYLSSAANSYDGNIPLMPPPPMPPSLGPHDEDFSPTWNPNRSWNSRSSTTSFNHVIDTPVSPPHFEQEGIDSNVVEYIDRSDDNILNAVQDVDHRQLHLPPTANITLSAVKEKGRSVDIDHRNLISLTGSPGLKTSGSKSKKEGSPLWSTEDKDFRTKMIPTFPPTIEKTMPVTAIDTDYRLSYQNEEDISLDEDLILSSPNSIPPLEPPNFASLNDFLSSSNLIDTSMPPPNFIKMDPNPIKNKIPGLSPQKSTGKGMGLKGNNGNDNVESIDMEMSDEDPEDFLNREDLSFLEDSESDSSNYADSTMPAFSTPTQQPFRPPLLKTPEYSPNQSWDNMPPQMIRPPNMIGNNGNMEMGSPGGWNPQPRMPGPGPGQQFRMPGNQSFLRGGFMSPQRGFPPQMKPNFRSPLIRPRNGSPYFNNRGRGGAGGMIPSNPFRGNPQNPFRGNFRGNNW